MRDYGKVHTTFWSSETVRSMSEDARMLALYLLTSPHNTIAGVFRLPDGYACEDLQWASGRVAKGFDELFAKGFANRCETTKWVWIRKHLEWNPPENPNQRKSAAKVVASVPAECAWKLDFMRVCGPSLGFEPPPKEDPSETVDEPFLNQEQEQEQEQEQDKSFALVGGDATDILPRCKPDEIVALYHEVLPEMPRVKLMNEKRKKALAGFWRWILTTKKPDGSRRAQTAEQALEWARDYFDRTRDNDFLMGRTPRNGDHANWQCDLDFLLTDRGMKHVIEKTQAREAA